MPVNFDQRLVILIGLLLAILILGGGGYFYFQSQKDQSVKGTAANTQTVVQQKDNDLVSEVGKLVDLPTDENPTIATIKDIENLKSQPLFAKAKNGDKVLVYKNAKKVIIYDPVAKKILDVAPISIGTPSAQVSPSPTRTPPSPSPIPTPSPSPFPHKTITIKATELGYLRVRDGPATTYKEIGQVKAGAKFEVFEQSEGWYQIEYEPGKYGWVSGLYVKVQ